MPQILAYCPLLMRVCIVVAQAYERRLVLPKRIDTWSLTSLQQRLVKTGGRLDQARPLLLAAAGRESSDATTVWKHGTADRRAALADRIAGGGGQANRSKEGGGTERCMKNRLN